MPHKRISLGKIDINVFYAKLGIILYVRQYEDLIQKNVMKIESRSIGLRYGGGRGEEICELTANHS